MKRLIIQLLKNQNKFGDENRKFLHLDLTKHKLPKVDLIFCRDCLVHLSFEDIFKAGSNIKSSGAVWFMTTTFPEEKTNRDIITGGWRPLNLELPPFNFPKPELILNENCTEHDGAFADKSLGLWKTEKLRLHQLEQATS